MAITRFRNHSMAAQSVACNCLHNVFQALDEVSIFCEKIILCGDFNVDLQLNDSRSNELGCIWRTHPT